MNCDSCDDPKKAHPLADIARHTGQPHGEEIRQEFAHRPRPSVAEMVDIIDKSVTVAKVNKILDDGDKILVVERGAVEGNIETQPLIDHVAADLAQIVSFGIEKELFQERFGHLHCRRFARTHQGINLRQRFLAIGGDVLGQSIDDDVCLAVLVDFDHLDLFAFQFRQLVQMFLGDHFAGPDDNFPRFLVDDVFGDEMALLFGGLFPDQRRRPDVIE
jgi:hypothetical protein